MRHVLTLLLLAVIATATFFYLRDQSSRAVKDELLRLAEDLDLPTDWTAQVKDMVNRFHDAAFQKALDVSEKLGRKFDERLYYDEIFERMIAYAREAGFPDLAARLEREKDFHSISVTER